jgi:hypothetical protein
MRKEPRGVYDKWNISVGDCDTDATQRSTKFNFHFDIIISYFVLMSQWVLFNANSAIVQLYYGVNYQWDDDEVRIVLNQHAELDLYGAS